MRQTPTACERCGLREVRHELEARGMVVRFCDACYWGDVQQPDLAEPAPDRVPAQPEARPRGAAA
jgi:hypothetical protein